MNNKIHQASKQSSQQVLPKQHPNAYKDAAITYFVCGLFAAIGGTILTIWASTEIFGSHIENLLYPACFAWALSLICMSVALYYKSKKTLHKREEKRDQHLPNVHDRDHGDAHIRSTASISAISSTTSSAKTMPPVVGIAANVHSKISVSDESSTQDITVTGIIASDITTQAVNLDASSHQTTSSATTMNSENPVSISSMPNGVSAAPITTNRSALTPIVIDRRPVNNVLVNQNGSIASPKRVQPKQEMAKKKKPPMMPAGRAPTYFSIPSSLIPVAIAESSKNVNERPKSPFSPPWK